jgi:hypothetical protein
LDLDPPINIIDIKGFHIIFILSQIGLELLKLRNGIVLPGGHGRVTSGVLELDVFSLVLDTGGQVRDVFVFLLVSGLCLELFLHCLEFFL